MMKLVVLLCLVPLALSAAEEKRQVVVDLADEILHCAQKSTEVECRGCCHAQSFGGDMVEQICKTHCDGIHKRQIGGSGGIWDHVTHIHHCVNTTNATMCHECCHSPHFDLPLEQRVCDTRCGRIHKRQIGGIWDHITHISHCAHEATESLCHDCCHDPQFSLPLEERLCDARCGRMTKRQIGGGIWDHITHISHCAHENSSSLCHDCCHAPHFDLPLEERVCDQRCGRIHKRQIGGGIWNHITHISHCAHENSSSLCHDCCHAPHFDLPLEERVCDQRCGRIHKRQIGGGIWNHITHISHCAHENSSSLCHDCCHAPHFDLPLEERVCDQRCGRIHKRQIGGGIWNHITHISHCAHENSSSLCHDCCHAPHFDLPLEERVCDQRCGRIHKRQIGGGIWNHITHISQCAHENSSSLCHDCCHAPHFDLPLEERVCDQRCGRIHKRQIGGGIWNHITHISHCAHENSSSLCHDCCHAPHFDLPLEERVCDQRCGRIHKRQIGGGIWNHITHISHCAHENSSSLCHDCCHAPHFDLPLEERVCDQRCGRIHKKQIGGGIWNHITHISHCAHENSSSLCHDCCHAPHFDLPLEERVCDQRCGRIHKKQIGGGIWNHITHISHCAHENSSSLCHDCCHAPHFDLPLEERVCDQRCGRINKRQIGGGIWNHITHISHCAHENSSSLCHDCCHAPHFDLPLEERVCDQRCGRIHKRQIGGGIWNHVTHINHCAHEETSSLCHDCCHAPHFDLPLEERVCDQRCGRIH